MNVSKKTVFLDNLNFSLFQDQFCGFVSLRILTLLMIRSELPCSTIAVPSFRRRLLMNFRCFDPFSLPDSFMYNVAVFFIAVNVYSFNPALHFFTIFPNDLICSYSRRDRRITDVRKAIFLPYSLRYIDRYCIIYFFVRKM